MWILHCYFSSVFSSRKIKSHEWKSQHSVWPVSPNLSFEEGLELSRKSDSQLTSSLIAILALFAPKKIEINMFSSFWKMNKKQNIFYWIPLVWSCLIYESLAVKKWKAFLISFYITSVSIEVSVWMFQIRMTWRWFLQLSIVVRNVKGAFLLVNNLLASSKERLYKTLRV